MFLKNFHIFIKKRAVLQQKFTVQVTTLADCDDITRFDGIQTNVCRKAVSLFVVGNLLYENDSVTKYICRAEYMRVIFFPLNIKYMYRVYT